MDELKQRILQDGIIIDNRILKIDNFLNQQIDTTLINHVGQEFARLFQDSGCPCRPHCHHRIVRHRRSLRRIAGHEQPARRLCPQEKIAPDERRAVHGVDLLLYEGRSVYGVYR